MLKFECEVISSAGVLDRMWATFSGSPPDAVVVAVVVVTVVVVVASDTSETRYGKQSHGPNVLGPLKTKRTRGNSWRDLSPAEIAFLLA